MMHAGTGARALRWLFLHPNSWTGEYPLLAHLATQGDEVCVLEEKRGLGASRRMESHFRTPGDRIATLWYDPGRGLERLLTWIPDRIFRRAFDGRNLVHRMWVIREAARRFAPDVIVCSDGFTYAIPAALLRKLGVLGTPVLASYIGGDVLDIPAAEYGRRRTPLVNRLLATSVRHLDLLRPVSPKLSAVLRALGASVGKIEVLPSHLTADRAALARVLSDKAGLRKTILARHGLPEDSPTVVTLSWNQVGKGNQVLAAAWPAIVAAHPSCRWLLAGPATAHLEQEVWARLCARGLDATVIRTGPLHGLDVYRYLAAADLHVNPSLGEGLNMVTVEAAAVGTPTITSDAAGIAGWVERLGFGAVVPVGDPDALAGAVIAALSAPDRLAAWRGNCDRVLEEFALERVATRLRALAARLVE